MSAPIERVLMESKLNELSRLQFLESRDGLDDALEWAQSTLRSYRSHVLSKKLALSRTQRASFAGSYLAIKSWLSEKRGELSPNRCQDKPDTLALSKERSSQQSADFF